MITTYTLTHLDGTSEEMPFFIVSGKPYLTAHVSLAEFGEHDSKGRLREDVPVFAFEPILKLFEAVREKLGPIHINSGYRSDAKQTELYKADSSGAVAKPGSSPHRFGAAMDLAIPPTVSSAVELASHVQYYSKQLGLQVARCGWREYQGRFLHMDVVYLLFAPYTNLKNPNPKAWRSGVTW